MDTADARRSRTRIYKVVRKIVQSQNSWLAKQLKVILQASLRRKVRGKARFISTLNVAVVSIVCAEITQQNDGKHQDVAGIRKNQ